MLQSQQFADAPRLQGTTTRCVRCIRVGDFAEVTKAGFVEMREHRCQELLACFLFHFGGVVTHTNPRFDESADEPRPYGPLMINTVALVNPNDGSVKNNVPSLRYP